MKTYCDNVQKKEITNLRFRSIRNGDGVQKLTASMPDDNAPGEWELHTLEDMRCNDNHQCPIKYCNRDIINSKRWLMQQPAYPKHLMFAPESCVNSDTPMQLLYTEMHTADWWWETQVSIDTRG